MRRYMATPKPHLCPATPLLQCSRGMVGEQSYKHHDVTIELAEQPYTLCVPSCRVGCDVSYTPNVRPGRVYQLGRNVSHATKRAYGRMQDAIDVIRFAVALMVLVHFANIDLTDAQCLLIALPVIAAYKVWRAIRHALLNRELMAAKWQEYRSQAAPFED